VQLRTVSGGRAIAFVEENDRLRHLGDPATTYDLVQMAIASGSSLSDVVTAQLTSHSESYDDVIQQGRLLCPLDHPEPSRCLISGTGLTHLKSAATRNEMHHAPTIDQAASTDSMRMFQLAVDGGKPLPGKNGVQPEWFFKGDGNWIVPPGQPLSIPHFALGGGEEAEIAGLYVIAPDGTPYRLGFALANEFSDHEMEGLNYLYLARSKLRQSSFGPELRVGDLPESVEGASRIIRGSTVVWQKNFFSGELNMAHSIANLEYHHFKYDQFRRPGDVHIHYFGAASLSFADAFEPKAGDLFEIEAKGFGRSLNNPLTASRTPMRTFSHVHVLG